MSSSDLHDLVALPDAHKERLALDLLAELGATNIQRRGTELIHGCLVCPHHTDQARNPTASLNWDRWLYNCFSGSGGTALWLIATVQDTTVEQARAWLTGQAGLNRAMELPDLLNLFDSIYTPTRPEPLPRYADQVLTPWQGIPDYILGERQIPQANASRAGICSSPPGRDREGNYMGRRAVIPHRWNGNLVGWQSRRLERDGTPKYLNTPGFPKDSTLYNPFPEVTGRCLVMVESPMSVLRHGLAIPMRATFGAEITDRQLDLVPPWAETLIWWLDNDTAGWNATESRFTERGHYLEGIAEKTSRRHNVLVVDSPYAADPADLDTPSAEALIHQAAVPWPVWQRPAQLFCHRCHRHAHPGQPCHPPA